MTDKARVTVRRFSLRSPGGGEPDADLVELIALAEKPLVFEDGGGVPEKARYRLAEECGSCTYFEEPGFCSLFDTEVEPEYVCDEWESETQADA